MKQIVTAKQTNPQRILLRCLLGIAALRIRTGVSCVCCTINELHPHSGFRLEPRHKDPLSAVSTTSFNMASKTSLKKIDKICTISILLHFHIVRLFHPLNRSQVQVIMDRQKHLENVRKKISKQCSNGMITKSVPVNFEGTTQLY